MIAIAILLGASLAGALALIAWLVHGRVTAADREADARVGQVATEAELERAQFELALAREALDASERRETIMQEAVADAINADPSPDLARNDVLGRVLRISAEWARADAKGRLRAESGKGMPDDRAADTPDPAVRPEDT